MGASEITTKAMKHNADPVENISNVGAVEKLQDKIVTSNKNAVTCFEDREEGEIIEDYELIISSDEEFCMRQRIEELEATNAELEKISKISSNSDEYAMDFQRAAQVPTDASSISSLEFSTLKSKKKRKLKNPKLNANERNHLLSKQVYTNYTEATKNNHKKHKPSSRRSYLRPYKALKEHSNSNESMSFESGDKYKRDNYLSREELRFAVNRFTNTEINSGNVRKCLNIEKHKFSTHDSILNCNLYTNKKSDNQEIVTDSSSNDSVSLEEQELRLIALKSAVMKKHLARKKRDAEVAYSPTDFEDVIANNIPYGNKDDDMDVVEEEIDQLEYNSKNSMEISPVASPNLNLSQEEDENSQMSMATEITEDNKVENTKIVDMDIANSDSDNEIPTCDEEQKKWLTLNQIPLPLREYRSDTCYSQLHFPCNDIRNPIGYSCFLPKYGFEHPPLPPGVYSTEEYPPPPPPYHLQEEYSIKKELNTVSCQNDVLRWQDPNSGQINAQHKDFVERSSCSVGPFKDSTVFQTDDVNDTNDENDEEEKALRALLLSKFNNSKVFQLRCKKVNLSSIENNFKEVSKPEQLNRIISQKNYIKKSLPNPTETILKEAVRRLTYKMSPIYPNYSKEKWENSELNVEENSRSDSPVETQTSLIHFIQPLKNTESNVKRNVSILNVKHSINLPLTFKEDEPKSKMPDLCVSGNNLSASKAKRIKTLRVRSVQKINKSVHCVENPYSNPNDYNNIKTETLTKNINFVDILYTQKASNNAISDDIIDANMLTERAIGANDNVNKIKNDIYSNRIDKYPLKESSNEENTKKNVVNKTDFGLSVVTEDWQKQQKINKPNKAINTHAEIQSKSEDLKLRKQFINTTSKPNSPANLVPNLLSSNGSRLIVNADISKIRVNKLIISLRASDTETSDEETFLLSKGSNVCLKNPQCETIKALISDINNDNYDNMSPISLLMESPGVTPNRSNSPSEEMLATNSGLSSSFVNNRFKENLDSFLKTVRTQVQQSSYQPVKEKESATQDTNARSNKIYSTVAMRHLPQASQQEYKRLVRRMQLLEKQKELRKKDKSTVLGHTTTKENDTIKANSYREALKRLSSSKATLEYSKNTSMSDFTKALNGISLCKSDLLKNSIYIPPTQKTNNIKSVRKINTNQFKSSKLNVLRAYENSFLKTGIGILTNLDKSLKLVAEAKKAKIEKLQFENKIKELRIQIEDAQHKLKHAQQKISSVYPKICESNELVTTLKQRRNKLLKAATNLGKLVKGDDYRLNNDIKQQITMKSKLLASQIKFINSMSYSDIEKAKKKLDNGGCSESNDRSHDIPLDKEQVFHYEKKLSENLSAVSKSARFESKITHIKAPLQCEKDSAENRGNKFSHEMIANINEKPNFNEDSEAQEKAFNEAPRNNDIISKETIEIERDISNKIPSASTEDENSLSGVPKYISPLLPLKSKERSLDPNRIICPYELMGECEDKDCNYAHINDKQS